MVAITMALRQIIAEENYPISVLAVAAGLPQPLLSSFLNGETSLNGESLDKLAEYLGVEPKQVIRWDEYVDGLRESGAIAAGWMEYEPDAWETYAQDAWNEYESDAWDEYETDAWDEYESEAWSEALASGDFTEDDYDEWKTTAYQEWRDNEYPVWVDIEYGEWCEREYPKWYIREYQEWENDYLSSVRDELERREFVVLLNAAE
ncbi:MAG: helix-turn-helix domain-containing protein [Pirellulaceae bacterium]